MSYQPQPARRVQVAMLMVAAGVLLWAIVEILGAWLSDDYSPLEVVWLRYATHLGLLVALFLPRRGTAIVATRRPGFQVVRGTLMLLMPACFLAALLLSSLENVLAVFWIVPLMTMALSRWLLRERIDRWIWLAGGAGWLGALMLVRPDRGVLGIGMFPALGMALCFSLYIVLTRQLRDESTLTNLVFTAACVLLPLSLILPAVWRTPSIRALGVMALIGVLGLGLLFMFDRALELASVSLVAPMLYLQPVWTVMLAAPTDSLSLGRASILGSVLVVGVCLMLLIRTGRSTPELTPEPLGTGDSAIPAGIGGEAREAGAHHA